MVTMATLVAEQRGPKFCALWLRISIMQRPMNLKIGHIYSSQGPDHGTQRWGPKIKVTQPRNIQGGWPNEK